MNEFSWANEAATMAERMRKPAGWKRGLKMAPRTSVASCR